MLKDRTFHAVIAVSPVINVLLYPLVAVYTVYSILRDELGWIGERIKGDWPLVFLFLCILLSTVFSQDPLTSVLALFIFTVQVFAYLHAGRPGCTSKHELLYTVLLAGGLVSLVGIIQYFFIDIAIPSRWLDRTLYSPEHYKRVFSTFLNPNVLAGYLIFIISIAVSSLNRHNIIPTVCLALSLLCLFFTFSRGGWFGAAVAVLTVLVLKREGRPLLVLVFCVAVIATVFRGDIVGRTNGILNDTTFGYRLEIWRTALEITRRYPLSGSGFGTAWEIIPRVSPQINALVGHAHSLYLNFAMETGIPGLIAFTVFAVSRIIRGNHRIKHLEGSERDLTAGVIGGMAGMLAHGFVDAVPVAPQLGIVIWLLLGIAGM